MRHPGVGASPARPGRTGGTVPAMASPSDVSRTTLWPWLVLLALLHVLPFAGRPALIGGDEPHYALMAWSMAVDHDLRLEDDYLEVEAGSPAAGARNAGVALERHLREVGGQSVFSHPLGLPLLAAPLVALLHWLAPGTAPDLLLGGLTLAVTFAALLAGWHLLAEALGDGRAAAASVFALYLATPLWYYSRTFYTEPYIWAFAVLSIHFLTREKWLAASLLLGATFAVKETSVLLIGPVLLFAWWRWGTLRALRLALLPAAFLVLWMAKNLAIYGKPIETFQAFDRGSPAAGAFGLLFDPSVGLLIFAPTLAVAALGWWPGLAAEGTRRRASQAALLVFLGYFVITAAWQGWEGGSSYASRLLLPAIPAFAVPLAMLWEPLRRRFALRRSLAALALVGFTIQFAAATNSFNAMWSIELIDLLSRRPLNSLTGLVLGCVILWRLPRFPRSVPTPVEGQVGDTSAGG